MASTYMANEFYNIAPSLGLRLGNMDVTIADRKKHISNHFPISRHCRCRCHHHRSIAQSATTRHS